MKLFKRFAASLLAFVACCAFVSFTTSANSRADEPESPVFATVTIASLDDLQAAAMRVAEKLEKQDQAKILFDFARSQKLIGALDSTQPIRLAFATDNNTVAPFSRIAILDPESEAIKEFIETIVARIGNLDGEARVKDNAIYVSQAAIMDFITSIPLEKLAITHEESNAPSPIVAIDLNLLNLPKEMLEAGSSTLRLMVAEAISELDSEEQVEQLDKLFDYIFDALDCVETLRASIALDNTCALVATLTATFKDGSFLADEFARSQQSPTRWAALTNLPNSIYSDVSTAVVSERVRELAKGAYSELSEVAEILDSSRPITAIIDEPENYQLVKELLALLEKAAEKSSELDVFDSGFAFLARPAAIVAGSSEASTQEYREILGKIAERLIKENAKFNEYIALDAEEFEGYSVSKITLPMKEFCALESYSDASIVVRLALASDAVVFSVALVDDNGAQLDETLKTVLAESKKTTPQPTEAVFELSQLALLAKNILQSLEGEVELTDEARATLECVASNTDAKITFRNEFRDNKLTAQAIASGSIIDSIKAIVDNVEEAKAKNSGEDIDDIFDEE